MRQAIKTQVKRWGRLRSSLVSLRGLWLRFQWLFQVLDEKAERKMAEEAMPALRTFTRGSCSNGKEMRVTYDEYTKTVSYEGMPISFESACFLWSLCEAIEPKRILDMGSGFSSFVFRRYQATAGVRPEVWSVDESAEWLEKTREFLGAHGLTVDNLLTWENFQVSEPGYFDLIMHDLGYMNDRPDIFQRMLSLRDPDGIVIVDDFHHPEYRPEIYRRLQEYDTLAGYRLRWLTLDKYLRYLLMVRRCGGTLED